ncbi:hypothetical protein [Parasphingopyxis sp.]|uniref:hypothetical protein n=1 Tax=Parasphingopyxis sp. TaxID=1920299 RepID=UPI0032EBF680
MAAAFAERGAGVKRRDAAELATICDKFRRDWDRFATIGLHKGQVAGNDRRSPTE